MGEERIPQKIAHPRLNAWTTEREIQFLTYLGGWRTKVKERETIDPNRRMALLLKYQKAIKSRVRWGDIEKEKIIEFLEKALKK